MQLVGTLSGAPVDCGEYGRGQVGPLQPVQEVTGEAGEIIWNVQAHQLCAADHQLCCWWEGEHGRYIYAVGASSQPRLHFGPMYILIVHLLGVHLSFVTQLYFGLSSFWGIFFPISVCAELKKKNEMNLKWISLGVSHTVGPPIHLGSVLHKTVKMWVLKVNE